MSQVKTPLIDRNVAIKVDQRRRKVLITLHHGKQELLFLQSGEKLKHLSDGS